MGYIKDERPATMMVEGDWQIGAYKYKAPRLLEEVAAGYKDKKLIGSLCMGCGKVIVPPRNICGRCLRKMDERIVASNWGTVTSFIVSPPAEKGKMIIFGLDAVETGAIAEGTVLIPVFVKFDGTDSNVGTELLNTDPKDAYVGLRVQAVWVDKPQGALSDLLGVEPIKDGE